jgi:hypothetical protein
MAAHRERPASNDRAVDAGLVASLANHRFQKLRTRSRGHPGRGSWGKVDLRDIRYHGIGAHEAWHESLLGVQGQPPD